MTKASGSMGKRPMASQPGYRVAARLIARSMLSAQTAALKRAHPLRTSTDTLITRTRFGSRQPDDLARPPRPAVEF
jgi:hypothetical protein